MCSMNPVMHVMMKQMEVYRLFLLATLCSVSSGATEEDLHKELCKYNRDIVPTPSTASFVNASIKLYLDSIIELNQKDEYMKTFHWLHIQWKDYRLSWRPEKYENITQVFLRKKYIWTPDIHIVDSVDHSHSIGHDDELVSVTSDGDVVWDPGLTATTLCEIDTRYYPFDSQVCNMNFETWMHTYKEVRFTAHEPSLLEYQTNAQWELVEVSGNTKVDFTLPSAHFELKLRRRRTYYIITIIIPISLLSVLNCFVFLLPSQSGEKMSFSVTLVLSYMVFLTHISDKLPRTSKRLSIFVVHLAIMLGLGIISILMSVISLLLVNYNNIKAEQQTAAEVETHHSQTELVTGIREMFESFEYKMKREKPKTQNLMTVYGDEQSRTGGSRKRSADGNGEIGRESTCRGSMWSNGSVFGSMNKMKDDNTVLKPKPESGRNDADFRVVTRWDKILFAVISSITVVSTTVVLVILTSQ